MGSFLNSDLELLAVDDESDEIYTALGEEYHFVDVNGKVHIQKDKIGKIGEYAMHLLLTSYYKIHCIIPKFRCTTDRNMSVFGIDSLFFDPHNQATSNLIPLDTESANPISASKIDMDVPP